MVYESGNVVSIIKIIEIKHAYSITFGTDLVRIHEHVITMVTVEWTEVLCRNFALKVNK